MGDKEAFIYKFLNIKISGFIYGMLMPLGMLFYHWSKCNVSNKKETLHENPILLQLNEEQYLRDRL